MAEIAKENESSKKTLMEQLEEAKRKEQEAEIAVQKSKKELEELKS